MPPTPKLHAPARWADHPICVLLIGCGGTGTELLGYLAKASFALNEMGHPGFQVCAFDADVVERPNLGRSNFYPCDIGYNKAVVSIQRINLTWGFAWDAHPCHFDANEAFYGSLKFRPDLIITCVDNGQFRADMAKLGRCVGDSGVWFLDVGNDSHTGQAIIGHWAGIGGARRCGYTRETQFVANVFDLYPNLDGYEEPPGVPSCSMAESLRKQDLPINRSIANSAMEILWGMIRGGIDHQGCFIDIRKGEKLPLPVISQTDGGGQAEASWQVY